jgi:hypothetical protein
LGCAFSGLTADAKMLIDRARVESRNHWFAHDRLMPVESIAQVKPIFFYLLNLLKTIDSAQITLFNCLEIINLRLLVCPIVVDWVEPVEQKTLPRKLQV